MANSYKLSKLISRINELHILSATLKQALESEDGYVSIVNDRQPKTRAPNINYLENIFEKRRVFQNKIISVEEDLQVACMELDFLLLELIGEKSMYTINFIKDCMTGDYFEHELMSKYGNNYKRNIRRLIKSFDTIE